MTKWLYFRAVDSTANDDGFISSAAGNNNSSLRSSALLKYENLEAILPFTTDQDEYPQGGSAGDYTGVMMIFKAALTTGLTSDAPPDHDYLHRDIVYLEVNGVDSISTCENIITFIEDSESSFIKIADAHGQGKSNCPSILECKFIEIARTWKRLLITTTHNANA